MAPVQNQKAYEKALNLALSYIAYQPRTIQETQRHLRKKGIHDDICAIVVAHLQDKNFLNDSDFARLFIQSKVRYKPRSKFALGYALKKKGVHQAVIDTVLEPYDDATLAIQSIEPRFSTWQQYDDQKFKKKVMNYLNYRGFSFEISLLTLDHFLNLKQKTDGN